jgi:riboflavin kinase/FMN adenylyltransferase
MQTIRGWRGLGAEERGAAVAFGAFDGVHLGHQEVIRTAMAAAGALGAPSGVATFEPDPWRWFHPKDPPFLLTTSGQRGRVLDAMGVDRLYLLDFDAALAALSAEDFARCLLAEGLGVRHVAVGFDFRFGAGRKGDPEMLQRLGAELGFGVTVAPPVTGSSGAKLSSTGAREALEAGAPEAAAAILGRPFAIEGKVVEGRRLGRELGFPTANVELGDYVRPRLGIYATRTRLPDGRVLPGVSSIGMNPTTGVVEPRLEVWLFDLDEDLYGQVIETELVHFLRPELKFEDLDALKAQVMADAAEARRRLGVA